MGGTLRVSPQALLRDSLATIIPPLLGAYPVTQERATAGSQGTLRQTMSRVVNKLQDTCFKLLLLYLRCFFVAKMVINYCV